MPDTLEAQIAETTQEIIDATLMMMPLFSPTINLVTRLTIPKGKNEAELPAVNSVPTVRTPTEGDEVIQTEQFDLTSVTITPVERVMLVRLSKRAERFSRDQLVSEVTTWLAQAQARNVDEDILAQFQNFHTDHDLGSDTTDLPLSTLRTAMRLLKSITAVNGGPAPHPISVVASPVACEDLLTDIGVQGVVSSTAPWIPAGLSQDVIQNFALVAAASQLQLVGAMVFMDSNIVADSFGSASGGHVAAMFSKKGLYTCISQDWQLETFNESEWLGPILRVYADFDTGVSPYTHYGSFILTDGV